MATMNNGKQKCRLLAIDDEPSMIEWLQILLTQQGYEVRTAMVGARAEEIFKTWRPAVVVTDMLLPDVDGLELLRRFKTLDALHQDQLRGHPQGPYRV